MQIKDRWRSLSFPKTKLPDVNDFFEEIENFNKKITQIKDALDKSENNLIKFMGLDIIETLHAKSPKINIQDITLALFYSFSSFFHGDFVRMLDLKFSKDAPYFTINIFYLDELLRDLWFQY